jgi:hypothetical protein
MRYYRTMKRTIITSLLLVALTGGIAAAGEVKEIELKDGSVITGEVQSLSNGVYTIRTESFGTVTVDDAKVRTIRPRGSAPSGRQSDQAGQARSLEEKMRSDKDVMGMIETLKDDPQFKKILDDPELLKAVEAGDIATLMSSPKFLQLMQNPTVQNIQQKVAK